MNTYTCNWPVKLNGKTYGAGQDIPAEGKVARNLENSGSISASATVVVEKAKPEPLTDDQLEMVVAGAVRQLNPETKGHFLKDGKPDVAALQKILDDAGIKHQLSAKQRDAIWEKIKPAPAATEAPVTGKTEGEGSASA